MLLLLAPSAWRAMDRRLSEMTLPRLVELGTAFVPMASVSVAYAATLTDLSSS